MTVFQAIAARGVLLTAGATDGRWMANLNRQLRLVQVMELGALSLALLFLVRPASGQYAVTLLATCAIGLLVTTRWRTRLSLSVLDDLPVLVGTFAAAQGSAYWVVALLGPIPDARQVAMASMWVFATVIVARGLGNSLVKSMRRSGLVERAVVVGSGRHADYIVDRVQAHPELGLRVVGQVSPASDGAATADDFGRTLNQLPQASALIVADLDVPDSEFLSVMRGIASGERSVFIVPRFPELRAPRVATDSIWGLPVLSVARPPGRPQAYSKRGCDIAASALALVLLAPLLLVVAVLIKAETGGSVLFRQRRIGQGGRVFEILKFQTMVPSTNSESDTTWNITQDVRVGPIGRVLRATSIDELPQLVNVLRGDMSLVGPRPERPHYVTKFSAEYPHYSERHRVPVGLTGWAQIHRLRGDTSIDDRARFDNAYCDNWSMWEDVKIILKTIPEVVRRSGG